MAIPNRKTLILILILITQLACVFFVSSRKQEFNIDEMYSYILSNSCHADKLSNADQLWERWTEADGLKEYVTVQKGERFAFAAVYRNNSTDCHPPLYYWLLHSVCSLIPDTFTKWTGLGLNALFFLLTLMGIYKISITALGDSKIAFLPVILYGFSPLAMETVTFIRMYMLLTMFAVILVYIHLRMFRYGITGYRMAAVWAVLYLGSMSHYYFIVLGFFGTAVFVIQNIKKSKRKTMEYALGCFAAEGLLVLTYPCVINHTIGSESNNVGNEIRKNLFDWQLGMEQSVNLAKSQIKALSCQPAVSVIFLAILLCLAVFLFPRFMGGCKTGDKAAGGGEETFVRRFMIWAAAVYACTFLSISLIGGEYVFLRYIYYIGPLLYVLIAYIIKCFCSNKTRAVNGAILIAILFSVSNAAYGAFTDSSAYLHRDDYKRDVLLSEYRDAPLVVITDRIPAVPTGNLTKMMLFERFYMAGAPEVAGKNIVGQCLEKEGECIVYVNTDMYYTDGRDAQSVMDELQAGSGSIKLKCEHLCEGPLGGYYRITDQTASQN